jgi:hypothetical protein
MTELGGGLEQRRSSTEFCDDAQLGYQRSRTDFAAGAPLTLDESYRLAHLPLVAPGHPGVIARQDGRFYEMGRHPRIFSLVLPVDDSALRASAAFASLEGELNAAPFAHKIAWELLPRRSDRLHATICGSLATGQPPNVDPKWLDALSQIGPFRVELRGLFSGNVNRGRLYLKVYPESRHGENPIKAMQAALGRPQTDLYLVGLYNLTDDLDAEETQALAALIARWWDVSLLRLEATHLWLLGACDDLVLDATVSGTLPLGAEAHSPAPALHP